MIRRRGAKRVFIVTDAVLRNAGVLPLVETTIGELTNAEYSIYQGEGNGEATTVAAVQAAAAAKDFEADLFVGLGGGSKIDLAKICRALVEHEGEPSAWFGFDKVPGSCLPLVCLPTTSGTGSEVSHSAVLRDSETGRRTAIVSQSIRPDVAIVDPYLSVTCPQRVTAESGFKALAHAVEAFLVTNFYSFEEQPGDALPFEGNNPLGDMYAERAIQLISKHLKRACEEPEDLAARSGMSLAATLAGSAFANCGTGLSGALEYSVVQATGCAHGVGSAIVLPEVMRYLQANRTSRIAQIAELINDGPTGLTHAEAANAAVDWVTQLRLQLGLPTRLRDVGVEETQLASLAAEACSHQTLLDLTPGNPKLDDALAILKACY